MVFKKEKGKTNKIRSRLFFHTNYKTGKKTFESGFLQVAKVTFWLWRTKQIYYDSPNCG